MIICAFLNKKKLANKIQYICLCTHACTVAVPHSIMSLANYLIYNPLKSKETFTDFFQKRKKLRAYKKF